MKIILKNGATYSIKRTNNNIIDWTKYNGYIDDVPEDTKSAYASDITLNTEENELSDLFKIESDFTKENISDVTFVTDSGAEIKDSYSAVCRITQNITDYVNETLIVLIKYQ